LQVVAGKEERGKRKGERGVSAGLLVAVSLVIFLLIYSTDINPARANKATLNLIRNMSNYGKDSTDIFRQATVIPSPHIDDIRIDFSRTVTQVTSNLIQQKRNQEAENLLDLADVELKKNIGLHPYDIRNHLQLAQVLLTKAQLTQNVGLIFEVEKILSEALIQSPKRQQVQYMLSGVELQLNKKDEAIKLLRESIDNDAVIPEGWWRLAVAYQQIGSLDKAKETVDEARSRGIIFNEEQENIINSIFSITTTAK